MPQYRTGMMTRVMRVEIDRPQATVIPRPLHISEPSPVPQAIGSMPRTVVRVVMRIGRRRLRAAVTEESRTLIPRSWHRIV